MAQIVGKYEYVSSENFEDYVKSLGKAELADMFLQATPIVEIQQNGDQWVVTVTRKDKTVTNTFKPGEEYDEQLPTQGIVFQSVTTKEGNGFKTVSTSPLAAKDVKVIRVYEFSDTGMVVHLSTNKSDVKAKRTYKRL
ncbi:fatty acid-binding protein 1, liver-like [Temnothorax americanus]|uniref:Fatty acid-binding protein 1, liver-like n=2 Tax=Temnothorax TaxID=300110 RepID=A0A6J1PE55_9HYME|nr:fatty acid-binding protein 1, liver-like [Temnothorax curvispinosus]TGZ38499.1 Fatty acid-binding protein-like protein 5 [Temnothorax longispinosus]